MATLETFWGSDAELENRQRLFLAVAAYAYEYMDVALMSDEDFDKECRAVNLDQATAYPHWDAWWRKHFTPDTGMWIRSHPDPAGLRAYVERFLNDGIAE